MANPVVVSLINRISRKYGVDPAAVRAVASVEGGLQWGAVGDQGSSFGPFQLHRGGALGNRTSQWANSPAGLDYAIRSMAGSARGKQGRAAVAAIVTNFERPANIPAEIAKASSRLGAQFAGAAEGALPRGAATSSSAAPNLAGLASVLASNNQLIGVPTPAFDLTAPPALPNLRVQPGAPARPQVVGKVSLSPTADRAGARTQPGVLQFAAQVAGVYGRPLLIGTGTSHNRLTVNGNVSDHWAGNAVDIPASGRELTRLGRAALVAAGMAPSRARKINGGLFNLGGHQVIFNTRQGGNHWNHLHISAH